MQVVVVIFGGENVVVLNVRMVLLLLLNLSL